MLKVHSRALDSAWFGVAIAVVAAVLLGGAVAVSRYAYLGGASGLLVAMSRCLFTVVLLGIGLKLAGYSFVLPRSLWLVTVINGVLTALMTYGNIGAVEYIPIGLASLLFYTYPVMIAVLVMMFGHEQVTIARVTSVAMAFIGLCIMLGVSLGDFDLRGTALSLLGALTTAINAVLVARYFKQSNAFVITVYFCAVAFIFLLLFGLLAGDLRVPINVTGWGGVAGVAILQALGAPLYFFAIREIGALKTGLVMNLQPVVSIVLALVLFSELLGLMQGFGGALVLLAIIVMQWFDLKDTRSPN